jgi:hypothetical protein
MDAHGSGEAAQEEERNLRGLLAASGLRDRPHAQQQGARVQQVDPGSCQELFVLAQHDADVECGFEKYEGGDEQPVEGVRMESNQASDQESLTDEGVRDVEPAHAEALASARQCEGGEANDQARRKSPSVCAWPETIRPQLPT